MLGGFFSIIVVVFAVGIAFFGVLSQQDRIIDVIDALRFIDIMLPVLAVGALVKYLFTFHKKSDDNEIDNS